MPESDSSELQPTADVALTDATPPDAAPATRFPVVAIGASAGGLAALSKLLEGIPPDSGMGFVVITHLDPARDSHMPELLGRHTLMPIGHAKDRQAVRPDHIYLIPPNALLSIVNGALRLESLPARSSLPKPIDFFMGHLGRDQKSFSIGIVLTGIDSDGTIGLKQIKAEGGMVMVQEPLSAEYQDMPRSAVGTGLADFVLPVEQMGAALLDYVRHAGLGEGANREEKATESEEVTRILLALHKGGAPDFREYKPGMILRRIRHRMGMMAVKDLVEFRRHIEESPEGRQALANAFLVGVTEFFREPKSWAVLAELVLPELFRQNQDKPIRAWVPACASGEEAYTLAMLMSEHAPSPDARSRIEIFATDIDRAALERARSGIYPASVANTVTLERLRRFFTPSGSAFQIRKELRSMIMFSPQNLLADPPFSRMNIVSCRNLLIYLQPRLQRHLASLFAFSLNEGGYLFLGRSENIVDEQRLFEERSPEARVFQRRRGVRPRALNFQLTATAAGLGDGRGAFPKMRAQEITQLVHKALLGRFTPAAALVDPSFQVLYFHGNVEPYVRRAPGVPSENLLEMAREGLSLGLRTAFQRAVDLNRSASLETDMFDEGERTRVRVSVAPVSDPHGPGSLYLTTFETVLRSPPIAEAETSGSEQSSAGTELERQLKQTRQDMQEIIQNLQDTNEELKISNEESLSMNEELQSANEELASSKEEMQSLNEEMTTVNAQLEMKVVELQAANDDLANLLQNTNIACLFLDRELRIRRYTDPIVAIFSVLPSDIGREFSDFASPFVDDDLIEVARRVLGNLNSVETAELRVRDGKWYWRSVQPYQTADGHVEGVVITFADITGLKRAEEDVRRLATVVQDSNDAITVHDFNGHILEWNRAAERMYGYTGAEAQALSAVAVVPESRRPEYQLMISRAAMGDALPSIETQRLTKDGRTLDVWLTVSVLHDEAGLPQALATTERDITDRLRDEQQLRYRAMRLQEADSRRTEFLAMLAHELRNPLAPVRNALELVRQRSVSPEQLNWATDLMDRQVSHLTRLVDDLLDVSRISSGKVRLQREMLDVRGTVRNAVEAADPLLQERKHRLAVSIPEEAIWVFGDAARLQQVIGNLLTNAYKYTEPGGEVAVEVIHGRSEVEIRVIDSGVGIAPELLPQIFEIFVQGDQTMDRSQGGLGIGLTLVRQLVEMHNGHVEAYSEGSGKGSEFVIRLPVVQNDLKSTEAVVASEPKDASARRRILIVDDNRDFTDSMKMLLEYERYNVKIAYDGMSALEVAKTFAPDVVLLDLGLPGMNGYETAQQLRAMPVMQGVLLIAVSGYAQEEDLQRSSREGFASHFKKPVEVRQILEVIQSK
jgi:two-component system, chemotaxis family, CheB/CheR fusion protein